MKDLFQRPNAKRFFRQYTFASKHDLAGAKMTGFVMSCYVPLGVARAFGPSSRVSETSFIYRGTNRVLSVFGLGFAKPKRVNAEDLERKRRRRLAKTLEQDLEAEIAALPPLRSASNRKAASH